MALERGVHPDLVAAMSDGVFYPIVMAYLDWPSGPVRVHANVGTVEFSGFNWNGIGQFAGLDIPPEQTGLAQSPAIMRLIGAPDEIDDYLDEPIRGHEAVIYFGAVTERAGKDLKAPAFQSFYGTMDSMRDVVSRDGVDIRRDLILTAVNGPSQRESANLFHTNEDQQRKYPTDTAGRLVIFSDANIRTLRWPE